MQSRTLVLALAAASACSVIAVASACKEDPAPARVASFAGCCVGGGTGDSGTTGPAPTSTVALATGVYSPQAIALDATNVYWTTSKGVAGAGLVGDASAGTGSIETVPRGGGSVSEVVAGLSSPVDLAIADTTFFYSVTGGAGGAVDAYTLGDLATTQVATASAPELPMVTYENTLYWATATASTLTVMSVEATGGTIATVVSEGEPYEPVALATNGSSVFVLATGGGSSYLFSGTIGGSGKATELWHAAVTASSLAVYGSTLYWSLANTAEDGGEILAMDATPGTPTILAEHIDNAGALAVASNTIYFLSNAADGALLSMSTGGGAVTTLASGLDYPSCLVVADAAYVGTASTITRVPF
jgi:hypothetical protein